MTKEFLLISRGTSVAEYKVKLQEPFCQTFLGGFDPSGDAAGFCAMVWHKGSCVQTYQLPISLKDLLTVSIYIYIYRNIYIYIYRNMCIYIYICLFIFLFIYL